MEGSQRLSWMDEYSYERQEVLSARVGGFAADHTDPVDFGLGLQFSPRAR
jgi:hypothetical protein